MIERPLTFDMDIWEGLSYGQHPEQALDVWELNDLAPRAGWPAVLFLHGIDSGSGGKESFQVQAPLLARKGVLVASASYRLFESAAWPAQQEDVIAAIDRLLGLQINPKRVGLWGVGAGGYLALAAVQALGPERIRAVVTVGAPSQLPQVGASVLEPTPLPSIRLLQLPSSAGIRAHQQARKWMTAAVADQSRGSKWKIRRNP
jgi:acetyl esterase/lipase